MELDMNRCPRCTKDLHEWESIHTCTPTAAWRAMELRVELAEKAREDAIRLLPVPETLGHLNSIENSYAPATGIDPAGRNTAPPLAF